MVLHKELNHTHQETMTNKKIMMSLITAFQTAMKNETRTILTQVQNRLAGITDWSNSMTKTIKRLSQNVTVTSVLTLGNSVNTVTVSTGCSN
jgi:outer membrane lipoprotein-sorting protein